MKKDIKTSIIPMTLQSMSGNMSVTSNNKTIEPIGIKMDQFGTIYTTESIPLSAVGFVVASTRDSLDEDSVNVEIEVKINKDLSHNQTIQYIETIAKPCLARYFLDMYELALSANDTVEEHRESIEDLVEDSSV